MMVLSSQAANNPNIIVIGNDANVGSISRNNPVFISIVGALVNNMHKYNFDVYDEAALNMANSGQQRANRSDAQIISIARAIQRPPIDVAVIFSMYLTKKENSYITQVSSRIEGRLLDVQTGRRLGNFEIDTGRPWNVPSQCNTDCILQNSVDKSRLIANDLGTILAEKLLGLTHNSQDDSGITSHGTNSLNTGYRLIFDGFSSLDFTEIEEYLISFSGYNAYRPIEIRYTRTEIWYKSSIGTAKLNRNLQKMLADMGVSAAINFSGNTFSVKKITHRGKIKNQNTE